MGEEVVERGDLKEELFREELLERGDLKEKLFLEKLLERGELEEVDMVLCEMLLIREAVEE